MQKFIFWSNNGHICLHKLACILSFAVTTTNLVKRCSSALIDPGSSLSFVNEETAKTLHLPISPPSHNVSMAVGSLKGSVLGHCSTEIALNSTVYENVQLKVMRNLRCDCWDKTSSGSTEEFVYIRRHEARTGNILASAWNLCGHSNSRVSLVSRLNPELSSGGSAVSPVQCARFGVHGIRS